MAKKKKVTWTNLQREIAGLIREGKSNEEIIALNYGLTSTKRVRQALEAGENENTSTAHVGRPSVQATKQPASISPPGGKFDPIYQTKYRIDPSEMANLGAIQAIPEDWRISQHGVFLMLDTYYLTKEEMGYGGSMGQFMVDVFRFYRQLMQYAILKEVGPVLLEKEVPDNGRGEEADGGAGVPVPGGGNDDEEGERAEQ